MNQVIIRTPDSEKIYFVDEVEASDVLIKELTQLLNNELTKKLTND